MTTPDIVAAELAFRSGNAEAAEQRLRAILARSPNNPKANELMGYIAANRGALKPAEAFLRKATRTRDGSPEAWYYLGSLLLKTGRPTQAAPAFAQALRMAGDFFEGLHDLGVALAKSGQPAKAIPLFERAQAIRGAEFELLNNKASALSGCGRFEEALAAYDQAITMNPLHPLPWLNRSVTLNDLGRQSEAVACYLKGCELAPRFPDLSSSLGNAAYQLNRHDEALAHFRRALALKPDDADAQFGVGVTMLLQGRLEEGFEVSDDVWPRSDDLAQQHAQIPRLRADSPASGKRVLLWADQGYGDSVQFCRYAPLIANLGADVTLEVQGPLKGLLSSLRAVRVVARGEAVGAGYDLQAPLISLPRVLRTTMGTIPADIPYLHCDRVVSEQWQERLGRHGDRPRVAIACAGNSRYKNDRNRSIPLASFAPLRDVADMLLVQKELSATDREFLEASPGMRFLGHQLRDFADTAAVVANVDLVITVDTSLAHVAGALGKPVWIALPWAPEWRWLMDRTDTPWYPTARLFRQPKPGDWVPVIAQIAEALQH